MSRRGPVEGWPLVGGVSLALAALTAAILVGAGTGEDGLRMLIRATARTSVALFALAFAASSLRRLWRSDATAWLLRNRRQLGVSFAVSHFVHLVAIVVTARAHPEFRASIPWITIVFGSLAYVFVAAMAATSFDRTAAWLGRRRWALLHGVGGWFLWILFAQSYLPRAVASPAHLPVAALVLAVLGVRIAARVQGRRAARTAQAA